jgi:hypothetical protein
MVYKIKDKTVKNRGVAEEKVTNKGTGTFLNSEVFAVSNDKENEQNSNFDLIGAYRYVPHLRTSDEEPAILTYRYPGSTLTSKVLVRLDSLRYCWMSLTTSADSISIDILLVYLGNKLALCKRKMFYWCRNSRIAREKISDSVKHNPVIKAVLRDPDPGSGAFLTPGSGMGKKSRSGSGMNIPDQISESLETMFWAKIGTGT